MPANIGLSILPEYSALAYDERKGTFVVQIRPPPASQKRPPLRLVLALDVSGSMAGDKLSTALASADAVVRSLSSEDTFAFVTFNSRAEVILPATAMNAHGKQVAMQKLQGVRAHGNTNLGAAILSSLELARGQGRAIVLTDGQPTEGVTSPDQLIQLTRGAAQNASLSAFGFGRDVNPLLLSSLSDAGRGNYSFIEAGEPPIQTIAAEVGGLLMTTAASFSLEVRPAPGAAIERALRSSDVTQSNGIVRLELPALIAEEDVTLPLLFTWSEGALGGPVAHLTLRAYDVATGQPIAQEASLLPRFASQRGPLERGAAREILLGRAAMALRQASQNHGRSGRDLSLEIATLRGELIAYGQAAGVEQEPQVVAALQMLHDAQTGLAAAGHSERTARQDMVATSVALSKKRSTMMGLRDPSQQASQNAFTSASQSAGIDFIKRALKNDKDPLARSDDGRPLVSHASRAARSAPARAAAPPVRRVWARSHPARCSGTALDRPPVCSPSRPRCAGRWRPARDGSAPSPPGHPCLASGYPSAPRQTRRAAPPRSPPGRC